MFLCVRCVSTWFQGIAGFLGFATRAKGSDQIINMGDRDKGEPTIELR